MTLDRAPLLSFTPSAQDIEVLEELTVGREGLLRELLDDVEELVRRGNRHHRLIIGPRGIGKSHLLTVLADRALKRYRHGEIQVFLLPEDLWGIRGLVDLAQAMGTAFDDTDFAHMKKIVDQALQDGRWVIFVGHEMGKRGFQVTDIDALLALCQYTKDPAKGVWLGTVQEIGSYIHAQRRKTTDARRDQ